MEYHKPIISDMSDYELQHIDGGVGFPVVVGALVAVVAVLVAVNVAVAGVLVSAGAMFNVAAEVNTVTVTM